MSEKKPIVLCPSPARGNCPVCGKPSYSATGTHPQCAVAHADALSRTHRKAASPVVRKDKNKPWTKSCPKCKRQVAARRGVCDCGHQFAAVAAAPAG